MDFEHFYTAYYNEASRYVVKHIGNIQDAEDVLSNTFLYCYDHYADYDPKLASERTWLYLVLKSRVQNYYRDRKSTEPLDVIEIQRPEERDYLTEAAELQDLRDSLAEALSLLPEKQRRLVVLRYFSECSTQEIAEKTGMSPGNVRTTLSRALDAMAKIMNSKGYGKEQ